MRQREFMRELFRKLGKDKAMVCAAYADAERRGEITRKRGTDKNSPEQYASDLWSDGIRKGWLADR